MKENRLHSIPNELLAMYFAGETDAADTKKVEEWASSSMENQESFNQFWVVWIDTGIVRVEDQTIPVQFDVNKAWDNVRTKKEVFEKERDANRRILVRQVLRLAAMVIVAAGLGWLVKTFYFTPEDVVFVAGAEVANISLPDGSGVAIRPGSQLIYPEEFRDVRNVSLQGEAYFEVNHDPDQSFVLKAGETTITVLGTSFNVRSFSEEDSVIVLVESGMVSFAALDDQLILASGEKGIYIRSREEFVKQTPLSTGIDHFWRTRTLRFRGHKLPDVIQSLENAYDQSIVLQEDALANCSLTVSFENDSLENILEVIALTLQLEVTRTNDQYILSGQGCPEL